MHCKVIRRAEKSNKDVVLTLTLTLSESTSIPRPGGQREKVILKKLRNQDHSAGGEIAVGGAI